MIKPLLASLMITHAAPKNAELKLATAGEYDSLNPLIGSSMVLSYIQGASHRGLNYVDAEGKWVPELAKEIPSLEKKSAKVFTENGTKKISAVFNIQDKASWGDGTPITCKDFDLSIRIAHSPNVSVAEKSDWVMVERVEWDKQNPNPKKCTFIYEKAEFTFNQVGKIVPLPSHLEGPIFEKYKNEPLGYDKNTLYSKDPTNKGLWNGPYLVGEVKLGSHIRLDPNPLFYGKQPKIKKIYLKFFPNTGTIEANLRSGTVDVIMSMGFTLDQALAFESKVEAEKLPYKVIYQTALNYEHIVLNLENPILASKNVRKALLHGLDRRSMVNALFKGKQPVAYYDVHPKTNWYTEDPKFIVPYPYSKAKAVELLEKEGWTLGKDGIRVKDGQRMSIVLMTTAGNKNRENVQTFIQEQWKQIGIEVIIKNEPPRVFFGETCPKRKFTGGIMFAFVAIPDRVPFLRNHSSSTPIEKNGYSGQNWAAWKNSKVDELLSKTLLEFSAPKRVQLMKEYAREYTDDVPHLPLYWRSDSAVIPPNLKNFKLTGHQYGETYSIEHWTLE